jgi:hypothetical protein
MFSPAFCAGRKDTMTKNTKLHAGLIGLAFTAALSLTVSSASAAVKFETVGPSSGATLSVRLVDPATGQAITGAHVYVIQRQWLPIKSPVPFINRRVELMPDGSGAFALRSNDVRAGATIALVADVADAGEVRGSVHVSG